MARLYVFADESGNFDFRHAQNVSRYFIVCTIAMTDCDAGSELLALRRRLAWGGLKVADYFHATTDTQEIRDQVFQSLEKHEFEIQATIMEKSKSMPSIRETHAAFYQHGWFRHFQFGMREPIQRCTELHVTAASVGTKKGQAVFTEAVRDVLRRTVGKRAYRSSFWRSSSDPCLQIADYCTWAIQRKWERGDARSYDLIKDRITYECDLFENETEHYY
jgi:hypothetical protein